MAYADKKILITGASGFIGSFLVEQALAEGYEVWAAVRSTTSRRYLQDERIRFVELSLGCEERLEAQLTAHVASEGAWQYVIHAAGATKCRSKQDFFDVNTAGTERLARLLLQTGALTGRFVFVSSLSVMGDLAQNTDGTPRPNTAYGQSKWEAEQLLAGIAGLDYVVLRPTGVYGPRERDYFMMAKSIAGHVDFAVGFKKQELTFIYVRDLVAAAFLALHSGTCGKSYALTDGAVYSSRAFSDLLQKEMGVRHVVHITAPLWVLKVVCLMGEAMARLTGKTTALNLDKYNILKQRDWTCDISEACHDLGYTPAWGLERGVKETVAWYKKEKWI